MRVIMVMFDSLNRRMLEPYGCDWVKTPNFTRLSKMGVTFDNSYVGSMPCMPARRELHTGRLNFLHRSWGPIEPFDDSMPEILKNKGVYTHLVSDHYHYWEDGGCTYHTRYCSWEISRGQEGDPWKGVVKDPEIPENINKYKKGLWSRQDWVNRTYMQKEEDLPISKTFRMGLEFIEKNKNDDNWFLQIETFDPHEPFYSLPEHKQQYPYEYDGPVFDWPYYREVLESPEQVKHCIYENAALVSLCDQKLGEVLDMMDRHHMWEDTMLIVNTDHGFLLGEHDFWGKCWAPFYDEVAHTPLFIWDPRSKKAGERRESLVQTIDLAPTILDFFGVEIPKDMEGVALRKVIENDIKIREALLFGKFGSQINVTDGKYVYMRECMEGNEPLYQYTLMPTRHGDGRAFIDHQELLDMEDARPFGFTKGLPVMRIPAFRVEETIRKFDTMLFDLNTDPYQHNPLDNPEIEKKMIASMIRLMKENEAPDEQYVRMDLEKYMEKER